MPVLSDLEPREVFAWFERLCAIPHGSHHAKAISDYLVAFAREHGLACRQDAANNVVIRKAASAGYENAPVVMPTDLTMFRSEAPRNPFCKNSACAARWMLASVVRFAVMVRTSQYNTVISRAPG